MASDSVTVGDIVDEKSPLEGVYEYLHTE